MNRRSFLLLPFALFPAACSTSDAIRAARIAATGDVAGAQRMAVGKAAGYAVNPRAIEGDLKQFGRMLEAFRRAVAGQWGKKDSREPTPREYVKYVQGYRSRCLVDFDAGVVTVETVDTANPAASLRSAVVTALLTPGDPRAVDLYGPGEVKLGETPFLYGEVLDYDGRPVRWEWRAGRFADALLAGGIRTRRGAKGTVSYVTIPMVRDHLQLRAAKYRGLVEENARRFGISRNLIFAVMKTESDFNPFAMSHVPAFGLMQVVPGTAGADVFRLLNGRNGEPSGNSLLDPAVNIRYGTAYLHLLDRRYLGGIADGASREYCVIAAYNGGPGAVLRTFDRSSGRAVRIINGMAAGEVYDRLVSRLPSGETRRYLGKVLHAKKLFVNL